MTDSAFEDPALPALITRALELRDQGESVSLDEICADRPDLIEAAAKSLETCGKFPELQRAYEHLPANPADDPRLHVIVLTDLARVHRLQERLDLSVARMREAWELSLRLNGADDRTTQRARRMLDNFEKDLAAKQAAEASGEAQADVAAPEGEVVDN